LILASASLLIWSESQLRFVELALQLGGKFVDEGLNLGFPVGAGTGMLGLELVDFGAKHRNLLGPLLILETLPWRAEHDAAQLLHSGVDGRDPFLADVRQHGALARRQRSGHLIQEFRAHSGYVQISDAARKRSGGCAHPKADRPPEKSDQTSDGGAADRAYGEVAIDVLNGNRPVVILLDDRLGMNRNAPFGVELRKSARSFIGLRLTVEDHHYHFFHLHSPFNPAF
jgi:hypothetical protein